ncbi:MAG: DUF3105 domain-containing protein [bacterium]
MSSRKDEQQRRRAERVAAEQQADSAARRRLMAGYLVAGALGLAVVVGLAIVLLGAGSTSTDGSGEDAACDQAKIQNLSGSTNDYKPDCREGTAPAAIATGDLETAATEANCELRLDLPDEGNSHFGSDPSKAPDYKTNPATSGDHLDPGLQQADGAYSEMVDPAYSMHSAEHGRIAIQYSPDLSEEDQLAIKGVFDESPAGVILFPNPEMPYEVAAVGWTQLEGCETYEGAATLDALRDFRDIYRGQGPEDVPLTTG